MKAISIIRFCILTVLFGVAMVLLLGEEHNEELLVYFLHVVFDKVLGFVLLAFAVNLLIRWCKTDSLFSRWIKMLDE